MERLRGVVRAIWNRIPQRVRNVIRRFVGETASGVAVRVLVLFTLGSTAFSALANGGCIENLEVCWESGTFSWEWWSSFFQNAGTEFIGGLVTFVLFEQIVGGERRRQDDKKALNDKINGLLRKLRSSVTDVHKAAYEEIRALGWFHDGTLAGKGLISANLQGADLTWANLQGANLISANLQGANLGGANLQGTQLNNANLEGADLLGANLKGAVVTNFSLRFAGMDIRKKILFDDQTRLPDETYYDPKQGSKQLERFGVTVAESKEEYWAWHRERRNKDQP